VLVMTHDHAEDAALIDAALRSDHLASIGLIGSSAKWTRFRKKLLGDGHEPDALERVTTPIGLPELTGKDPATIAVGVAAALLLAFEREPAAARRQQTGSIEQSASIEPSGAVAGAEPEPIDESR
jgi:xanthine dehydrogenase accessory factor